MILHYILQNILHPAECSAARSVLKSAVQHEVSHSHSQVEFVIAFSPRVFMQAMVYVNL